MIRIALVENHVMVRQALKLSLDTIHGFKVVEEAECGLEFQEKYNRFKIDIVLMELRLNGQHGYTTCKHLLKKYPRIKIIVLSMFDDPATIISMIRCGAVAFLSKRDSLEQIEKAIREVSEHGFYFNQDIGNLMRYEFAKIHRKPDPDSMDVQFSAIEMQIATHFCNQLTTLEIAKELGLSHRTIESHKRAMIERTLNQNFIGVIIYMFRNNLLYPHDMETETAIKPGQRRIS